MDNRMICAAAAVLAVLSSTPARAGSTDFMFSGSGVSGMLNLTYQPDTNTGILGTSPNLVDPVGSQIVTGIGGTFSDSNLGLSNVAITEIVASNPANPDPTNLLAPHSFGFYDIVNGVPGPGGTAPGFSYDDLLYPAGSPQTASDYTFHGGLFDIYGIVFTLANGDAVNLWSNGDMGAGVNYGVGVTDGINVLDYESPVAGAVPEPSAWAMLIAGFTIAGGLVRRQRQANRAPAFARG